MISLWLYLIPTHTKGRDDRPMTLPYTHNKGRDDRPMTLTYTHPYQGYGWSTYDFTLYPPIPRIGMIGLWLITGHWYIEFGHFDYSQGHLMRPSISDQKYISMNIECTRMEIWFLESTPLNKYFTHIHTPSAHPHNDKRFVPHKLSFCIFQSGCWWYR